MAPIKKVRAYRRDLEAFPDKWKAKFDMTKLYRTGADGPHYDMFESTFTNEELREFEVDTGSTLNMRQYRKDGLTILTWHPIYKEVE